LEEAPRFFGGKLLPHDNKKIKWRLQPIPRCFFGKKKKQNHHISRKQTLSLLYLKHRLLYVTNITQGFQKILFFSLTFSQIWLHPHLD